MPAHSNSGHFFFFFIRTIKDYKLRTGTSVKHLGGRVHNVSTIWIHPKYIYSTRELDYDVALLEIEDTFEYSDTTKPIAIAKSTDIKPGDVLIVSGWGKTKVGLRDLK